MSSIFDRMAAERARALVERQNPVVWKLNEAALEALRAEGKLTEKFSGLAVEENPLFGLPIVVDGEDRSEEPRFQLMALKPEADGQD